ncbi:MAG TPA: M23 family metallopeptidase [Spirochaetota bacterium]|jgi:murein DD-endopeptidase MepM/ murein hydrolase activator NlpD|nr:M23 family metallopeptidase [Spirochaetota bacterium]HPV43105.1 M23 family metallopeptidase [Spirochaetota bacterium]
MLHWPPFSRYQVRQIKFYSIIGSIVLAAVLVLGNIIAAIVCDHVTVKKGSYITKQGFPLFTDAKEYIRMVKTYPHNPGVRLFTHRLAGGESYWDVAYQYHINIDTLIGANPFITSLVPKDGIEVVVPAADGLLLAFDDILDVRRMRNLLEYTGEVRGDYLPTPFKIISTDDIRLVFFKGVKPVVVNNSLEKLYRIKNIFQSPIQRGFFTSLFGDRVHPFMQDGEMRYHNGVDIVAGMGTPVYPTRDGMVIFTGWRGGFGNTVMVQHHEGYTTLYGHLESINTKVGDWVTKKDMIGRVGSTGWSTGPHLHFTVMKHGWDIDPLLFIW